MTVAELPSSIVAAASKQLWSNRYAVEIEVGQLLAGTPGDPKVVEGYLRSKLRGKSDELKAAFIDRMAQKVQVEIAESLADVHDPEKRAEMVLEEVARQGGEIFKRDPDRGGELYEEGRKLAAMLKESASAQWPNANSGRPAVMNKNARQWWPEHVYVPEDRVYLGRFEVDDILRRVVHTRNNYGEPESAFATHEVLENIRILFTIASDKEIPEQAWFTILARAEIQGFGAARSMGYGRFVVTRFERIG